MAETPMWPGPSSAAVEAASTRLRDRYPSSAPHTDLEIADAVATGNRARSWQSPILYLRDIYTDTAPLTSQDMLDALAVSAQATRERLKAERDLIEMARKRGVTWARIGEALGRPRPKDYLRWLNVQLGPQPAFFEKEPAPV